VARPYAYNQNVFNFQFAKATPALNSNQIDKDSMAVAEKDLLGK